MKQILENWKRYLKENPNPEEKTQVSLSDKNTAIFKHWREYVELVNRQAWPEVVEHLRDKLYPAFDSHPKLSSRGDIAHKIMNSRDSAEVKRLLGIPEDPVSDK